MTLKRTTERMCKPPKHARHVLIALVSLFLIIIAHTSAQASDGSSPSEGALVRLLLEIIVILIAAKLGGDLFVRLGQPAVLGELIFGIVVGNLSLVGIHHLDSIRTDEHIRMLSEIGVIVLLFQVGLESDLAKMAKVGASAVFVATLGVVFPMLLGWSVAKLFLPNSTSYVHLFVGATLCATSVGLTARVLRDLGRIKSPEARVILGAAVIDDVQGLVVLATLQGMITAANAGKSISLIVVAVVVAKALAFLVGAILIGRILAPQVIKFSSRLKSGDLLVVTAFGICLTFAEIAALVGLAPIVGAFAAGLILDEVHWKEFAKRGERSVQDLIQPLAAVLVPIFFVRMGAEVNLETLANPSVLAFALVLTLAAVLGKQACSLGILNKSADRLSVGIGMIPRGEVGLIFAAIGSRLILDHAPVVSPSIFSAVVIMVILTTMLTPPALKWSLSRIRQTSEH